MISGDIEMKKRFFSIVIFLLIALVNLGCEDLGSTGLSECDHAIVKYRCVSTNLVCDDFLKRCTDDLQCKYTQNTAYSCYSLEKPVKDSRISEAGYRVEDTKYCGEC